MPKSNGMGIGQSAWGKAYQAVRDSSSLEEAQSKNPYKRIKSRARHWTRAVDYLWEFAKTNKPT